MGGFLYMVHRTCTKEESGPSFFCCSNITAAPLNVFVPVVIVLYNGPFLHASVCSLMLAALVAARLRCRTFAFAESRFRLVATTERSAGLAMKMWSTQLGSRGCVHGATADARRTQLCTDHLTAAAGRRLSA